MSGFFFRFLFARGQSLINDTLCPMMHWACESICHRGNIGTNLSSGEGDGFNPADEKRNVQRKMDIQVERRGKWDDEERVTVQRRRRGGGRGGGEGGGGGRGRR